MWVKVYGSGLLCACVTNHGSGIKADWYFEAGGVGSHYCDDCKRVIEECLPTKKQIDYARAWGDDF